LAHALDALKRRAQAANIPVVYVNDNFGRWQSDLNRQVEHCLHDGVRGRPIAELLRPNDNDYFVLKPKHSGFYCTTLDLLLRYLQVKRVVLTGVATNICVLFTAHDAYLRDLEVVVPADCSAANSEQEHQSALDHMARVLKTDVRPSKDFDFAALGR
jgi:nicotinamidase-related amidase